MNDAFLVTFGCFCLWNYFSELLDDLACLEEYFDVLDEDWYMFLRSSFCLKISRCLLDLD